MTNQVTYAIELTPENAPKIDAINRIILGTAYTSVDSKVAATEIEKEATTASSKAPAAKEPAKTETSGLTLDQVKRAAKKAKSAHDEDFANSVLDSFGVKEASTLGRRMSSIDESDYQAIVDAWAAGPQVAEQASDEPEDDLDDGFDDDDGLGDDESEVTAEAVKTALKAYAKEVGRDEAKEIMTKHGAAALSKVDDCTPAQLKAMFAELV
jgi:hypothetical protein